MTLLYQGEYGKTFTEDEVWSGDYQFVEGTLDLNGHSLTVEGDFIQSGGIVKVNNGLLIIKGSYIQKAEDNAISTGRIIMVNTEDIIDIDGSFTWYSTREVEDDFIDGKLIVGGNIKLGNRTPFYLKKNHTLVLKGKKDQNLSFDNGLNLANVRIEYANEKNVTFANNILVTGILDDGGKAINGTINICSTTKFANNKTQTNVYIKTSTTSSENLEFGGNVQVGYLASWFINSKVQVNGNVSNSAYSYLVMNGGELRIKGNCNLLGSYDSKSITSLTMTHSNDYIFVEGNFTFAYGQPNLTDGILEVKGDYSSGFQPSGKHKVILSGSKKQTILAGGFNTLELANTSEEGIYASRQFIAQEIITNGCKFVIAGKEAVLGWKLTEDMTIGGDLLIAGNTLDLNGHHLTIQGDLTQSAGAVYINGGELTVEGDYRLESPLEESDKSTPISYGTIKMLNNNDVITVKGDFISQSIQYGNYDLVAGTMNLYGDFIANSDRYYFSAMDKHTVNMCGTKRQTIKGGIWLQNLIINNQSNSTVDFNSSIIVRGTLTDVSKNVGGGYYVFIDYVSHLSNGYWSGNLYISDKNKLTEDLYVEKYLYLDGWMEGNYYYDLNGHKITAKYITTNNATINLNHGNITCFKNMSLGKNSTLSMANKEESITIGGNFVNSGSLDSYYLKSGVIEVKGDFTDSAGTYQPCGDHTTILSGKSMANGRRYVQTISTNSSKPNTKFNKLVLTKDVNSGYVSYKDIQSISNEVIINIEDQEAPTKVDGLQVTSASSGQVRLSWKAATDNTAVIGYEVYRDEQRIATTSNTNCKDIMLEPGQAYHYKVYAFDEERNLSEVSDEVIGETTKDAEAPEVPKNLAIQNRTGSSITIGWSPAIDNVRTLGYEIYRDGEQIATTTDCSYQDKEVKQDIDYTYTIKAYDKAENKSDSSDPIVSQLASPKITSIFPEQASTLSGKSIELIVRFKNVGYSNRNKVVFDYSKDKQEWTRINPIYVGQIEYNATEYYGQYTWKISELPDNGEYYVRYTVIDADGNEASKIAQYHVDKDAPANVNAFTVESKAGLVYLRWLPSTSQYVESYSIYRKQSDMTKYTKLSTITDPKQVMFVDETAKQGIYYDYYIIATNKYGQESLRSDYNKVFVEVDNLIPYVSSVFPRDGRVKGVTDLRITAKDNLKVSKIVVYMKEENNTEWEVLYEGVASDGICTIPWDTNNLDGKYQLKTIAIDSTGNESKEVITGTYEVDNKGISKIEGVRATSYDSYIKLEWNDVTEKDFGYFVIEEKDGDSYKKIGQESVQLGYYVNGLQASTEYTFRVVGYDNLGNRGVPSDDIVVSTKADEVQPVIKVVGPRVKQQKNSIPLTMTVADNIGAKDAYFYYSYDKNNWELIKKVTSTKLQQSTTYEVEFNTTELKAGTIYIKFDAYDANGNKVSNNPEVIMEYDIDRTPPKESSGVKATGYDGYIEVTWDPGEDDIKAYNIYRADETNIYELYKANVSAKNFIDTGIENQKAYSYKIQPIDVVGNEGELSTETIASSYPDTQKPVICGIGPKGGTVINSKDEIKVATTDNTALQQITVDFKKQEDDTENWSNLVTETISGKEYLLSDKWNAEGISDGMYQIRVQVMDRAGNVSDYTYVPFTLDTEVEQIEDFSVDQGNWEINLNWSVSTEKDFSYYEIYRKAEDEEEFKLLKQLKENTYSDKEITPEVMYEYKVRIYDESGNCEETAVKGNYALDVDMVAPVSITAEYMQGVVGEVLSFDGTMSTDNVKIMRYEWDMGDGSKVEGPNPFYGYKEAGTYTVTLTVVDAHNNTGQSTIKVQINEKEKVAESTIRVTSRSGGPIPYANICIEVDDEVKNFIADYNGEFHISLKEGAYNIAAFDTGYLPADLSAIIYEEKENLIELQLDEGELITGDLNIHRMSLGEMIAAGIDLSSPENMETFSFTVELVFQKQPIPVEVEYYIIGGDSGSKKPIIKPANGNSENVEKRNGIQLKYVDKPKDTEEDKEDVPVLAYISTCQTISWLKKMYQVDLGILNNAEPQFTITDSKATLELPEGVTLAATKNGQSLVQSMGTIQGKEKKNVSWYVMSEDAGNKKIKASFDGVLNPFKRAVHADFEKSFNFEQNGDGLSLTIYAEDKAYIGEEYYMQFRLENTSEEPMYNVQTSFPKFNTPKNKLTVKDYDTGEIEVIEDEEDIVYSVDYPSQCQSIPVLYGGETISVKALLPGESLFGTYKCPFNGKGDPEEEYYELISSMVKVLGKDSGVDVHVETIPSHISKYIIKLVTIDLTWADPIESTTGAFTEAVEALAVTGDSTLSLDLEYNSLMSEEKGELGHGWSHNFESNIEDEGAVLKLYQSPGQYITFVPSTAIQRIANGIIIDNHVQIEETKGPVVYEGISSGTRKYRITRDPDATYCYVVTYPNGETDYYGKSGRLRKMTTDNGKEIKLAYNDKQTIITNPVSDQQLILSYNEKGYLISVEDGNGRITKFAYKDGNLVTITNPINEKTSYEYDKENRIKTSYNNDNVVRYTNYYDDKDRILEQDDSDSSTPKITMSYKEVDGGSQNILTNRNGEKYKLTVDKHGNLVKLEEPEGGTRFYTYNTSGELINEKTLSGATVYYEYDSNGNRTKIVDCYKNETTMTYDQNGNVISLTDPYGVVTNFEYDDKNQLISQLEPSGLKKQYEYNSKGQLLKEIVDGACTKMYSYNKGLLTSVTDKRGEEDYVTYYTYDAYGNVKTTSTTDEISQTFDYDTLNRLTKVEDNGNETLYTYDCDGNQKTVETNGIKTTYEYKNGNLVSETKTDKKDKTYSTQFENDAEGSVTEVKNWDGNVTKSNYDKNGNIVSTTYNDKLTYNYTYDIANRVTEVVEPGGLITKKEYYPNDRIRKVTNPDGTWISYIYDKNWRLKSTLDNQGRTTSYEYDQSGNLISSTNEMGNTTQMEYDKFGNMITSIDAMENVTQYDYNKKGECVKKTNALKEVSKFGYDNRGNLTSIIIVTENGDVEECYTYDKANRLISTTDPCGNTTYQSYDANGNLKQVSTGIDEDDNGEEELKLETEYEYNAWNQLMSVKGGDKVKTAYEYNKDTGTLSKLIEYADTSVEKTTSYEYDELNRLNKSTDALEGTSECTYTDAGMVASIINPLDGGLSYEYDEAGRVTSIENTNGQIDLYTYNAAGLLESIEDANSNQTTYVYDKLGRIERLEDELGSITYTYDKNSNIVEVKDEKGTISRTYDALNRVKTYTDYKGQTVEYSYDELGNLISLTYPGGEIVRYTYYENGTLESVKDWNSRATYYYYTDSSRISSIERPDGTTVVYEYDVAGRRTSMKDIKEDTKAVISEEIYTYDKAGQITTISKTVNESSSVESANNIKSVTMTYDNDNRMLTYNGEEVQYDDNGNMIYGPLNGEMVTYEYDCRNRLIKAGDVCYEYDAEDQRIAVNEANKRTEYVINSNTELSQVLKVTEYDLTKQDGANEVTSYVYGTGLLSQDSETTGYLTYHFNQVGSTTALTDQTGEVVQNYSYDPYGELLTESTEPDVPDNSTEENSDTILDNSTDNTTTDITNTPEVAIRFLYNGEYGVITDANNLYFMRERYYNVDSKRFISEDVIVGSISDSASLNRYAYVQGNPITYVDPLGLSPYSTMSSLGHSLLNVAGFVPGLGEFFDCVNAIWYAAEGNSKDALSSFISAIPFVGSVAGNSMKWLSKGAKWATKASKYVDATCNIIAGASTLYRSSDSASKRVQYLYDNYIKTGKKFDGRAASEVLGLALDVASSVLAGKQMKGGIGGFCKQAKEDWQLRKALDGYSMADGKKPSLKMNLQLFASNGSKSGSSSIKPYEVTTYDDFRNRSVVGDGLEGHELWQHANLKENGYATTRLSTEASKNNPVIALPHEVHVDVNKAQYSLNAKIQSPLDNINANANILYNHSKIPNNQVDKVLNQVLEHYQNTKK